MTDITLEQERLQSKVTGAITVVFTVLLLLTALLGSVKLLIWTTSEKLAKIEVATSSHITTAVRERQLECLAKNIYYEAGNEPFEGKAAVAIVTLNRAASGKFPDDICQVIYQKNIFYEKVLCQFSWVCSRATIIKPINKASYTESMEVAKKVLLEDFRLPSLKTALFYHATYISPGWSRKRITQIGQHIFYE